MLSTSEIRTVLARHRETGPLFHDVFPADKIPRPLPLGKACIVNTDPSYLEGEHWVAIYRHSSARAYYFDPLGIAPIIPLPPIKVTYNRARLQGDQPFCGYYVLLFVLSLARPGLLDMFTPHCATNDSTARLLALKEFGL